MAAPVTKVPRDKGDRRRLETGSQRQSRLKISSSGICIPM